MDQSNSTAVIRAAINIFLCIAIGVSLFQELNFTSNAESPEQPVEPVAEINQNGTKVDGLVILSTDHFRKEFKELLIQKDYNIEIKEFPFEGNEYWINLFLTHGHILVVFFMVSRYQSEQDQSKKTKLMIVGMVLVFGWMFFIPQFKTKRLGLEYKGVVVYQRDTFIKEQLATKIGVYEQNSIFDLDPIPESPQPAKAVVVEQPEPEK